MLSQSDLLQIVHALEAPRGLACRLHGRQQQRNQDGNDCDHHQELDQREPRTTTTDAVDVGAVVRGDIWRRRNELRAARLQPAFAI